MTTDTWYEIQAGTDYADAICDMVKRKIDPDAAFVIHQGVPDRAIPCYLRYADDEDFQVEAQNLVDLNLCELTKTDGVYHLRCAPEPDAETRQAIWDGFIAGVDAELDRQLAALIKRMKATLEALETYPELRLGNEEHHEWLRAALALYPDPDYSDSTPEGDADD